MAHASNVTSTTEPLADGLLIRLTGEIDYSSSPQLRRTMEQAIHEKPQRLIIDLQGVPYMDSSGVAVLVETLQKQTRAKGKLVLCNLQNKVRGIFQIARLDMIFLIAEGLDQARQL